jgi:hypothetical protein
MKLLIFTVISRAVRAALAGANNSPPTRLFPSVGLI